MSNQLCASKEPERQWRVASYDPSLTLTERFRTHFTAGSLSETFQTQGYAVMDGLFGGEWCANIRAEIAELHGRGLLQNSQNMLAAVKKQADDADAAGFQGYVLNKPNIYERSLVVDGEVTDEPVLHSLKHLKEFYSVHIPELTQHLNVAFPDLRLGELDELKLQYNAGNGGSFPMHFDTAVTTGRELTAILYLNEDWMPTHGGELRIYPFPYEHHDIAPRSDRFLLFCSHQMLHRIRF